MKSYQVAGYFSGDIFTLISGENTLLQQLPRKCPYIVFYLSKGYTDADMLLSRHKLPNRGCPVFLPLRGGSNQNLRSLAGYPSFVPLYLVDLFPPYILVHLPSSGGGHKLGKGPAPSLFSDPYFDPEQERNRWNQWAKQGRKASESRQNTL